MSAVNLFNTTPRSESLIYQTEKDAKVPRRTTTPLSRPERCPETPLSPPVLSVKPYSDPPHHTGRTLCVCDAPRRDDIERAQVVRERREGGSGATPGASSAQKCRRPRDIYPRTGKKLQHTHTPLTRFSTVTCHEESLPLFQRTFRRLCSVAPAVLVQSPLKSQLSYSARQHAHAVLERDARLGIRGGGGVAECRVEGWHHRWR